MYVVLLGLVKVFDEMPHQAFKRGSIVLVKNPSILLYGLVGKSLR